MEYMVPGTSLVELRKTNSGNHRGRHQSPWIIRKSLKKLKAVREWEPLRRRAHSSSEDRRKGEANGDSPLNANFSSLNATPSSIIVRRYHSHRKWPMRLSRRHRKHSSDSSTSTALPTSVWIPEFDPVAHSHIPSLLHQKQQNCNANNATSALRRGISKRAGTLNTEFRYSRGNGRSHLSQSESPRLSLRRKPASTASAFWDASFDQKEPPGVLQIKIEDGDLDRNHSGGDSNFENVELARRRKSGIDAYGGCIFPPVLDGHSKSQNIISCEAFGPSARRTSQPSLERLRLSDNLWIGELQRLLVQHSRREAEGHESSEHKKQRDHRDPLLPTATTFSSLQQLATSATAAMGMKKVSESEFMRGGLRASRSEHHLPLSLSTLRSTAVAELDTFDLLKEQIRETKYITAIFEARCGGGLAPLLDVVNSELAYWLGPTSRLLAAACEMHWSVPENSRSRLAEIRIKDALHRALRENNLRVMNLYDSCRCKSPPPIVNLIESKTEESCVKNHEINAFQGIYRRVYPDLLHLQDPTTARCHRDYWPTMENLSSDGITTHCENGEHEEELLLRPEPAKFLRHTVPLTLVQMRKTSMVVLNMAVLRLANDDKIYRDDDGDDDIGYGENWH